MKTSVLLLAVVALAALSCVSGATLHGDAERARIHQVVNSANVGWTAGFNSRFAGRPIHAAKKELGVLPDNDRVHAELPEERHHNIRLADIPKNFDPRKEWPMCKTIHEVRDQSGCGSCWAFGAVEAGSDRICIATNGAVQPHLSAEDMVGCCTSCGFGCNGGYPSSAWSFMKTRGIVTGGNYGDNSWCSAYSLPQCNHHVEDGTHGPCGDFSTPKCPSSCDSNSTYTTPFAKDKYVFNSSYSIPRDTSQIQQELMTRGPVEASFSVYADFMEYKGGVYRHVTGSYLGGHAVKLLGWGVDEVTNVPYWLLTNSWNEEWGEKGFFRVLRGSNECGIEGGLVAGMYSAQ